MEIYWICIGYMMCAKIRFFFESSKQNTRNLIHFTEIGGKSSHFNAIYPNNLADTATISNFAASKHHKL